MAEIIVAAIDQKRGASEQTETKLSSFKTPLTYRCLTRFRSMLSSAFHSKPNSSPSFGLRTKEVPSPIYEVLYKSSAHPPLVPHFCLVFVRWCGGEFTFDYFMFCSASSKITAHLAAVKFGFRCHSVLCSPVLSVPPNTGH